MGKTHTFLMSVLTVLAITLPLLLILLLKKPIDNNIRIIKGKDSIIVRIDTVRDTSIRWIPSKKIHDTVIIKKDTVGKTITNDTLNCWSFEQDNQDSSKFEVSLCSKYLLSKVPEDASARIKFIRSPYDTVITKIRVDVKEIVKDNRRKEIRIGLFTGSICLGVGLVTGVIVANLNK